MKVNFGIVKRYVSDRGFGFIAPTFAKAQSKDIFFHIKVVKKGNMALANDLAEDERKEPVSFWYQVEETPKGQQVNSLLNPEIIKDKFEHEFSVISSELEAIWRNINNPMPSWVNQISIDVLGDDRTQKLILLREDLEQAERERKQKLKEQEEALRKIREAEDKKKLEALKRQQEIENNEFNELVAEMSSLGFTHSKQVSSYIARKKLGNKYKNISGIVRMEQDGNEWDFKGGFPREIYRKLCEELGLENQQSGARAIDFKSYNEIESDQRYD